MPPAAIANNNVSNDTLAAMDHHTVGESDSLSIDLRVNAMWPAASPAKEKYPAKMHALKVAKELGRTDGIIYLPGLPTPLYEDSDMGPSFRQRRYFYYLGGTDFDNCAVTYDLNNDQLILWVPYIDPRQVLWYGTIPGPAECMNTIDVDAVHYMGRLKIYLEMRLGLGSASSSGGALTAAAAVPAREPVSSASIGSSFCRDGNGRKLSAGLPQANPRGPPKRFASAKQTQTLYVLHPDQVPACLGPDAAGRVPVDAVHLRPAMDAARVVKTPYEIAMIRKANEVSSSAHRAVLRRLKGGRQQQQQPLENEAGIEAVFLDHCRAVFGAKQQAYPVIAGAGAHSSVLHYFANDAPLADGQLVCLDAGAEWALYASDVTRTFPVAGAFTPAAASIYKAVQRMQEAVFARFAPGAAFAYLHVHAAHVATDELLALGILRGGTATEIMAQGTISAFFPHGLGHHVGLEVHDVLSSDLMARPSASAVIDMYGEDVDAEDDDEDDALMAAAIRSLSLGGSRANRQNPKRQPVTPMMYAAMVRDQAEAVAMAHRAHCAFGVEKKRCFLEPGMVVTVEPGIYFCRPYIESFFLKDPKHARFINQDVLKRFYDVGGVRIEDCLLVTETGHENLTTAPKGAEMLRIINGEE